MLANVALSVLDDHFAEAWASFGKSGSNRYQRRRKGLPTYRLVRYADDFVVMVSGTRAHAERLREETAAVLSTVGLRLSEEKTRVAHIDEGFDFLGFRIRRDTLRGTKKLAVFTYPSRRALASIRAKVKAISKQSVNSPLSILLRRLNPVLRGWTYFFRHGSSNATFGYLGHFTWWRVVSWLRRKHRHASWKFLIRRYFAKGWWPEQDGVELFDPGRLAIIRYRYRAANIPTPWSRSTKEAA